MFCAEGGWQLHELMIVIIVVITDRLSQGDVLGVLKVHPVVIQFFLVGFGPWRAVYTGTLQQRFGSGLGRSGAHKSV